MIPAPDFLLSILWGCVVSLALAAAAVGSVAAVLAIAARMERRP